MLYSAKAALGLQGSTLGIGGFPYDEPMPKAKEQPFLKDLLARPEWQRLAAEVALEAPQHPKPRFQPWRGRGKGVRLDAVLQDLRR